MSFIVRALSYLALLVPLAGVAMIESEVEFEVHPVGERSVKIRFQADDTVHYQLSRSENMRDWKLVGEPILGSGAIESVEVSFEESPKFFRISEIIPDSILSEITEIDYPFRVYLPPSYTKTGASFPVIYATDGQWLFNEYRDAIVDQGKEVILVGIDEGPMDRRLIDYTSSGATDYFQFLISEFIPVFERYFRVNPDERSICGASLGGLFTGLALLMDETESPVFKNYLSFDGSFWWDRNYLIQLEQTRFDTSQELDATLFLSSALGESNNDGVVSLFESRLNARNFSKLTIIRRSYDVNHVDVGAPSFKEALELLF